MRWIDDVKNALVALGGEAHLSQIYEIVEKNRSKRGDTMGKLKSWVRNTLQQNSREKGKNIFKSVYPVEMRKGIWRLL
ncbi:MAG: hypothetical protein KJ648_03360 [Candidatus Omnitrophica bacterium]|nr:hypothetical protein [Candidatus Omnitrophota bacterium]